MRVIVIKYNLVPVTDIDLTLNMVRNKQYVIPHIFSAALHTSSLRLNDLFYYAYI
jgi:hypothetical protein